MAPGTLTEEQLRSLDAAEAVLNNSYNPYSHFAVGACLVTENGELVSGTNVENAAYGSTICAERSALVRANAEGHRVFRGISIIGRGVHSERQSEPQLTGPCGACRQMLYEFAELGGNDPWVVLSTPAREKVEITSVRALLPYGFGPNNLKS
ncbi:MAG: cytidine deaminase [Actinobacteria bacterium]|nr:MAG: cytidine deaminase [Actinomycetota bacterium]